MKRKKRILRISALLLLLSIAITFILTFSVVYARESIDFSLDEELFSSARKSSSTTYLAYDTEGALVPIHHSKSEGTRYWRGVDEMGEYIKLGFISAEDRAFYRHHGFNLLRMGLAAIKYIGGKIKGTARSIGASTITQQVIKNISGDNQYSLKRKFNEIIRAWHLELYHTKDEILEMYLNIVPMTDNIQGVCAASEIYFGKEPCQLSLSEAATIIGITNSPSRFNPYTHPDECVAKRNRVLYAMYDNGAISKEDMESASEQALNVLPYKSMSGACSWFVESAREDIVSDLMAKYNISSQAARLMLNSGCQVILTMDIDIQRILEQRFEDIGSLSPNVTEGLNYSMVITDAKSGNLLGIIGSAGKKSADRVVNLATTPRAPGSTLKPIALYAPLIDSGRINWATVFDDIPTEYVKEGGETRPYPRNSPNIYDGLITVKDAIRLSKNTVALRLYDMLGKEKIFDILENKYKFKSLVRRRVESSGNVITDLDRAPLALGQLTDGVSLRELTEAYSAFCGSGKIRRCRSYYAVVDSEGKNILENKERSTQVFSDVCANIMNQLLSCVTDDGTARSITLKNYVDTAGKTGTSGADRDRWFIGYTPYYCCGIWTGYPGSNRPIGKESISHISIWDEIMLKVHREKVFSKFQEQIEGFSVSGLERVPYCKDSGMLEGENCALDLRSNRIEYGYFTPDNKPSEMCNIHIRCLYDVRKEAPADEYSLPSDVFDIALLNIERDIDEGLTVADMPYVYDPQKKKSSLQSGENMLE